MATSRMLDDPLIARWLPSRNRIRRPALQGSRDVLQARVRRVNARRLVAAIAVPVRMARTGLKDQLAVLEC